MLLYINQIILVHVIYKLEFSRCIRTEGVKKYLFLCVP